MLWEPLKGHLLLGWAGSGEEGREYLRVRSWCFAILFHRMESWAWAFANQLTEHSLPIASMHFQAEGPFIKLFDADVLIEYRCAGHQTRSCCELGRQGQGEHHLTQPCNLWASM